MPASRAMSAIDSSSKAWRVKSVRAELEQPPAALVDVEAGVGGPGMLRRRRRRRRPQATRLTCWVNGQAPRPPAAPPDHLRRGAARGRDGAIIADARPTTRGSRGSPRSCAYGLPARSRTSARRCRSSARPARRRRPGVRAGARAGAARSASRARDHHRRRPGDHGGGQPRRPRSGRAVDRPRHRAAARAGDERLGRPPARLPLLLHAQGHVRPLRERVRGLPRRLRDAGRAVRGADAAPDREDPRLPDRARRQRLLGRPGRLAARARARRAARSARGRRHAGRLPTTSRTCSRSSRPSSTGGPRREA